MFNRIDQIYSESNSAKIFAKGYFTYLTEIFNKIDLDAVEQFAQALLEARSLGKRIFFIGNGGSAATASHFANDIGIGTKCLEHPFKAISLTDNNAVMTAIGNDFGYSEIFLQQLKSHKFDGDVLVAISASGNSENIIKAVDYANANKGITVGLSGFDGGLLKEKCQVSVHVPSNKGEYGPVEDLHMIFDHLVHAYLCKTIHSQAFVTEHQNIQTRVIL